MYESYHGESMSGNPYALYKYIQNNGEFKEYTHIWILKDTKKFQKGKNTKYIKYNSIKNAYYLLVSKYLINNTTFQPFFSKKCSQIYINTWHGTPLKSMGRNMTGTPLALSNTQRNFIQADIVSLSNKTTIKMANDDYMLKNLGLNNIQMNASPRNSIFFDSDRRDELKSILKIDPNKTYILWMPTWRGSANDLNNIEKNIGIFKRMANIVTKLDDSIVLYAKPHPLMQGKIELEELGLEPVPEYIEIYDFANATDALITDYSSIMFDYANLNKPIILDLFDIGKYTQERGFTLDISFLPFKKVSNETELLNILNNISNIKVNYTEFNAKYNARENINAPKQLLDKMFVVNANKKLITGDKKKVLIYPGTLVTNGITTAFLNLMSNIDTNKRDYVVWLPNNLIKQKNINNINKLIDLGIDYISSPASIIFGSPMEIYTYYLFLSRKTLNINQQKILSTIMQREIKRCFGNVKFDHVVHFAGYEAYVAEVFKEMDAKLHIWVHNNMEAETRLKNNYNVYSIQSTYDVAQTIVVVNDSVKEVLLISYFNDNNKKKVVTVQNTVNAKNIIFKANQEEEYLTDEINEILDNKENIKFISIGRFSPEKGLERLIDAFDRLKNQNPDLKASLFIIGGYGNDYSKVVQAKEHSESKNDIYLFKDINPFPILKKSDLMVSSSYHEGLPMVFFEALTLHVPVLSTAIPGPKEFLESGYGYTCENSTSGLISGMQDFLDGKFTQQMKELSEFNKNAIDEFESIFDNPKDIRQ